MGFFPTMDGKETKNHGALCSTTVAGIQFNWKPERRCSLRMHSHNRQYSVGTGCHVITSPFCFARNLMIFTKMDHLSTNLTEVLKFVKHESCLHAQPSIFYVGLLFQLNLNAFHSGT